MLYLGIAVVAFGVALFIVTQIVVRRLITAHKKSWEDKDEMS